MNKRTKALQISKKVKLAVWERQNHRSLFEPYVPITWNECCCHYIGKGQGGLGIEENIFGCCCRPDRNEHYWFDGQENPKNNMTREEMHEIVKNHLSNNYKDWNEDKLHYKKF